jgi:uncharacterized heparinase superfamily protein
MDGAPITLWALAVATTLRRQVQAEWDASPLRELGLGGPRAQGFATAPPDLRPADAAAGQALLGGVFILGGERLAVARGDDPWRHASPSRRFAEALHGFSWMRDLLAVGEPGAREGLRLTLEWRREFGRWNAFAWSPRVLERRVFNLACTARRLTAGASDLETAGIAAALARQARFLLRRQDGPARAAERLTVAAIAGAALGGEAGARLMQAASARLAAALDAAVLPDGGHASRSPEAGVELLFDLSTLDEALSQRGRPPPEGLSRAIDRLAAAARFFTLPDGRLAAFQGGEARDAAWIAAALAREGGEHGPPPRETPQAGYQRLAGRRLQVIADAGAPAAGPWSLAACGQPLAIEVVCGRDRLITNSGWSPIAQGPQAWRRAEGGSTAVVGEGTVGRPARGWLARAVGPRLIGAPASVSVERRETDTGVWLEIAHAGWREETGLTHERRLYLDKAADELRGEDRFAPGASAPDWLLPIALHFHVGPDVTASLARDQKSVLLRGASGLGWWLRNDAEQVAIEPSTRFDGGRPLRASQVILRTRLRANRGGRLRWKLAVAEGV